jgi:hypothetical protein
MKNLEGTVRTIEEAKEWFATHSTGSLFCERTCVDETGVFGLVKEVNTFPEAKAFFEDKTYKDCPI